MKKHSHKTKFIIPLVIIVALLIATIVFVHIRHSKQCRDIIGDGYAMGTDPEPVVIGNTCDL